MDKQRKKLKVNKTRPSLMDKFISNSEEPEGGGIIKVKTPRKEYAISVGDITANEAIEKVKKEYPTFTEFEYKTITYKKTGAKGEFIKRIDPPEKIEQRWQKKKDHIRELSDNVGRLKNRITRDLKGEDEKLFLTALIIAVILRIGERIGNEESANYIKTSKDDKRKRAFGVSGFKKSHVDIIGNKIHFTYIGKKGVPQDKSFSDEKISKALKSAIKKSPSAFIFTTSEGQKIGANQVNDYLRDFNITAKGIRGYYCNRGVLDKLKETTPEDSDKKRKKQLNIILKNVAAKVGHGPSVLKNQYLIPEVVSTWIDKGEVFDIKEAGYTMKEGGKIEADEKNAKVSKDTPTANLNSFKSWFGNSKVVDADGNPLVVFHGTDSDFTIFDRNKTSANVSKFGFFFSDDKEFVKMFGGKVLEVYVSIKKPLTISQDKWNKIRLGHAKDEGYFSEWRNKLIKDGYDGVYVEESYESFAGNKMRNPKIFIAFYPEQIKLSEGNKTFSPKNTDIRYKLGGLFHGSHKKFTKFSLSNVGEGGKSVGGWGIYLSTSPEVAKQYQLKSGALYGVTVSEDGEWLDFDEPISDSIGDNILKGLAKKKVSKENIGEFKKDFLAQGDDGYDVANGKQVYDYLSSVLGSEKKASEFLLSNGIIGNRFKDKTLPDETNYVVFDADTIRIDRDDVDSDSSGEEEYAKGGAIPQRYKDLGFSHVGQKKKSIRPEKKWMVLAKKGDKYRVVHGGQKGMEDFSQHKDKKRQRRFWDRMGGFDSEKTKDPFSPLYWHKRFGTWEEGGIIEESDSDDIRSDSSGEEEYSKGGVIEGDAFKKWFGKSKVIDEKGNPKIVYHGTGSRFNKFNIKKTTQGIFWFTSNKSDIEKGEVGAQGKGYIMELYASLQNPAGWNEYEKYGLGQLRGLGYDGAILPEKDGSFVGFVFNPTQLKSATNNKGTFDPNNADIRLENGGGIEEKEHNNILSFPLEKRIEFIEKVLKSNPYYSEKTLDFKSLSKKTNEFIESHLEFNKYNPIITKYEDKAYFEPDKRHTEREGYLLAQVEYALHFITGATEDKKQRFYDQAKYEYVPFIIPTLTNPDDRFYQKENDSIIYVKNIVEEKYCCAVLYIELDSDGSLRVVTVLPQQKKKQIQKKKASGRWTDASFISLSTEKSSSGEAISGINDDIDDPRTQDKGNNNSDNDKKKFALGGNVENPIKIFDNNEILQEKGLNTQNKEHFSNSEKSSKFISINPNKDGNQIIEGTSREAGRTTSQARSSYPRGSQGTSSVDRSSYFGRQDEERGAETIKYDSGGKTPTLNSDGGYEYSGKEEKIAEHVGLITLPKKIAGTNCENCIFQKNGFCDHEKVLLPVTNRMCCALWNQTTLSTIISEFPNADFFPDSKLRNKKYPKNANGGYDYDGEGLERAKNADLITLPKEVLGTTCKFGNCKWTDKNNFCTHPKVKLPVTERMSCSLWDNDKVVRPWGEMKEILFAKGGLIAPNGKKSNLTLEQYKLVRTPAFKKWFGDWENDPKNSSKVVDENGEPLVVYNRSKKTFSVFDVDKQLNGWLGKGFYFSESKFEFKDYGNKLLSVFINIRNPFIVKGQEPTDFLYELKKSLNTDTLTTTETLKENSYDGVVYKHWDYEGKMFSCFEPNQIKLADGTNTTFDPNNPDIRYEKGGKINHLKLYHGTSLKHLPKIEHEGLISKLGYGAGWYMLSSDFESALFHAVGINEGDDVPVVEFSIPVSDNDRWIGYPYLWKGEERTDHSTWYAPMKAIPKEFIKKVHLVKYNDWLKQKSEGFKSGGKISTEAQKQIDSYIKEGIFIKPTDKPVVGVLPISRFNGPNADIFPSQLSVDRKGVERWRKRIEAGERPYILIDYREWAGENRVIDAHHRLKAYEDLGINDIPVIDVNGRVLNASKMASGGIVDEGYKKWKRKNVTFRGMKEIGVPNEVHGSLGNGLYTAPLSNKGMAREYGTLYFVVNGRPNNPKKFNSLNEWEIWFYNNLVYNYSKAKGKDHPDKRDFNAHTTIEAEMQKLGYDGIEIVGREIVNFKPEDVKYFRTEDEVKDYYDRLSRFSEGGGIWWSESGKKFKIQRQDLENPKEFGTDYLYHVTSPKNRENILKNGIKVGDSSKWEEEEGVDQVKYKNLLFASMDKGELFAFNDKKDIWAIDLSKIKNKWYEDPFSFTGSDVATDKDIPASAISLYYDGKKGKYVSDDRLPKMEDGGIFDTSAIRNREIAAHGGIIKYREAIAKRKKYLEGGKTLYVPNGRPSNLTPEQRKLVKTTSFKKWYGDWEKNPQHSSKTLSRDGEPIVYYHGSPDNNITIFDRKKSKANQNVIGQFIYFSREKSYSSDEKFIGKSGRVYEVFLNIRNPLDLFSDVSEKDVNRFFDYTKAKNRPESFNGWRGDWSSAFEEILSENENPDFATAVSKFGFDAVYYHNSGGDEMFAVIDSNQIKLADGSNTTFDKNNPDIRYKLGGSIMEREAYSKMSPIMQREFLARMNPIGRREFLALQKVN